MLISHVAFNPKPFISTFEAAVDRLIALRKDVQAKTEQMEKNVRAAEREYSKKLSDLNRGFEVSLGRLMVRCES
jgi:exocyst complex component 5